MTEVDTRIHAAEELPEDELDRSLRPRRLEDFVGQEAVKEQLAVSIAAAASRGEPLDHVLLAGPRVVTLDLPPFTLIGATTRTGLLSTPLRDRFGIQHRLEHYGPEDLSKIVLRSARLLEVEIDELGARAIAARSRGTPRVANRLLKRVRDFVEVRSDGVITTSAAAAALDMLQVDHEGLDRLDREILRAICEKFAGGPVGLSTLAVAVGEEQDTIEDVYEPYLLQRGLIERTPRGRLATKRAFEHLGFEPPGPLALL